MFDNEYTGKVYDINNELIKEFVYRSLSDAIEELESFLIFDPVVDNTAAQSVILSIKHWDHRFMECIVVDKKDTDKDGPLNVVKWFIKP